MKYTKEQAINEARAARDSAVKHGGKIRDKIAKHKVVAAVIATVVVLAVVTSVLS